MKKLKLTLKLTRGFAKHKTIIHQLMLVTVLLCSLFYIKTSFAETVVIHDVKELGTVLKNAPADALMIFDVDEVLVYPENIVQLQVAAPFWEATMDNLEKRLGKPTRDLLHSIMLLQSKWQLTDPEIPKLIQELQLQKIRMIALTAFRSGEMGKLQSVEDWRSGHLKKHNIDLSITAAMPKDYFEITQLTKVSGKNYPVYKDGIIYTNHYPKGEVLGAFLAQMNLKPKSIIFIDDKLSNILSVENFCNTAHIKYIGVHDNRIIKNHNIFNKSLGEYQFDHLERHHVWLSDLEAKKILNSQVKSKTE